MKQKRFTKFILLVDGIQKCIHKLRVDRAADLGVKSVHVFWILYLLDSPKGLTATELAAKSMVDRSLVSREIAPLVRNGYITSDASTEKRAYNARFRLTEKGVALARRINDVAESVRADVDEDISEEELAAFYTTLEKMHRNFLAVVAEDK